MTDVGEYCRQVEDYLTRVNGGHLVRIVGPGFELVRAWADEGIPLSVVFRGIEMKADRQRARDAGAADAIHPRRPLRIEFCEADVRDVYDGWRKAVGLFPASASAPGDGQSEPAPDEAPRRRVSIAKHLDRAIDRLARAGGSLELPERFRETLAGLVDALSSMRETARRARGPVRAELADRLAELDRQLTTAARDAMPPAALEALVRDAEQDLSPFRGRLPAHAWQQAVDATVARLLRDRLGLPVLELSA